MPLPLEPLLTPGTFTNRVPAASREQLVVTDPWADHHALTEVPYVNPPTTALCNTDSPLHYVDASVPCNNEGAHSVSEQGLIEILEKVSQQTEKKTTVKFNRRKVMDSDEDDDY
ncbi:40S ribosomal protein SA [Fukomys damarensis]|uniref:40S ribosomal protein SA n=1 Tax=Fukomys damarensis TaxID=885580 RepID=A0A091D202_FUKDA|nr:40S ribosomal protein SA [Fukomys damarensis]